MEKKKKFILVTLFVVMAVGYNMYSSKGNVSFSELTLANMEALAGSDETDDCDYQNGYTKFSGKEGGAYDCCKKWVNNAPAKDAKFCR